MDARELANAAAVYFGGWRRAEHVLTCDDCRHDEQGRFVACGRHPDQRRSRLPQGEGGGRS